MPRQSTSSRTSGRTHEHFDPHATHGFDLHDGVVGRHTDSFDLDRNVHRPFSDPGVGRENVGGTTSPVDAFLHYVEQLYATALAYGGPDPNLRVLEYLRYPTYVDVYSGWQNLTGDVDRAWIDCARANGPSRVESYRDPSLGVTVNVDHLGATANAVYLKGSVNGVTANQGDFGGWGGDLATFYGEWRANSESCPSGYAFCTDRLAKVDTRSSFPLVVPARRSRSATWSKTSTATCWDCRCGSAAGWTNCCGCTWQGPGTWAGSPGSSAPGTTPATPTSSRPRGTC
jgi:hypothetical protein